MKEFKTLAQAFSALANSDQKGIYFINQTESDDFVSYGELYKSAVRALGQLQKLGLKPQDELILQVADLKSFVVYFWACVLGKIIPVPLEIVNSLDKAKKLNNIWKVLNRPSIIYDDAASISKLEEIVTTSTETLDSIFFHRSFLIEYSFSSGEVGKVESIEPEDYCYIQFSSGSTGIPKGAAVTHKNLVNNVYDMIETLDLNTDDSFISWKPLVHDFSMIAFHIMPLVLNASHYRMHTNHFIWNPSAWLNVVNKYRISVLGSPNFGLRYFLNHYQRKKSEGAAWDLSCIKLLMNGAETISSKVLEQFAFEMKEYGLDTKAIVPVWGLAEATLMGTRSPLHQEAKVYHADRRFLNIGDEVQLIANDSQDFCVDFVDVGEPLKRIRVRITDDANVDLGEGKIGHVQIQGITVINQYYNNPEASDKVIKDGWLDTGDMGFMKDGRLVFTGRFKEIIIINGVNYYPFDIEECLLEELGKEDLNKYVACSAYNSTLQKEELLIFVYFKGKAEDFFPIQKIIQEIILRKIGLVTDYVIPIKQVPKTTSGKIMRRQLASEYVEGKFEKILRSMDKKNVGSNAGVNIESVNHSDIVKNIQRVIIKSLEDMLGENTFHADRKFSEIGVKSLHVVPLINTINENLNIELQVNNIFDSPTINLLTNFIHHNFKVHKTKVDEVKQDVSSLTADDRIAIIGMGCRFPAGGNSPSEFWNALVQGVDGIVEVPSNRWNSEAYFDANKEASGKMYTKYGGFLEIPIDEFDAQFFNLSPKEAKSLDPQQRLLLEVSWEAFEDAGIDSERLNDSNTGVFLGMSGTDYLNAHLHSGNFNSIDAYSLTGTAFSTAAGRLSYFFGLQGPCFTVDTACSSTLVALHLAFQSLRNHEVNMALVGGSHLILAPYGHIGFSKLGAISEDGHSKSFDASANGYARSEGCGVIILKRLSDALKDNDNVLAIVRGTATNQDGKSNGLTAPSGTAQQKVIVSALKSAGLNPEDIDYIETHGTGTPLGDPIEVNAIANVYGKGHSDKNPILIGSVKSNVGHLEPVAGMAGLTKIIKAFENEKIPANLNFNTPNPYVDWNKIPVKVIDQHYTWKRNGKVRRAGINSFGFGGSNAHIILEEPPVIVRLTNEVDRDYHTLNISAKSREALVQLAFRYVDYFSKTKAENISLADVCYTANVGRTHFRNNRLSISGSSVEEISAKLDSFRKGNNVAGIFEAENLLENNQVVFLFTGQGSQYVCMGKTLYETSQIFKTTFDACDKLFYPYLLQSIKSVLEGDKDSSLVNRTDFAQPIIFSIQIALIALWKSFGIEPNAVAGHSIGEFAAAVVAEIMSLEEAVRLVAARGRLMNAAPGNGKMLAVYADEKTVAQIIAPFATTLSIAAINLEIFVVISGEAESLRNVVSIFESRGIETKALIVSHAFHSPLMDPVLNDFKTVANSISYRKPTIDFISTLTGATLAEAPNADYWAKHLRNPVRFYHAIKHIVQKGYTVFLEIGGTPTLSSLGKQIAEGSSCVFLNTLKEKSNDWQQISLACAGLYTLGFDLDWQGLDKDYHRKKISIPHYPFQRKKYWMDLALENAKSNSDNGHAYNPLIGQRISSPAFEDTVVYQSVFTSEQPYFMQEHIIYDAKISPAAAHVSMLLSITKDLYGHDKVVLQGFDFLHPLVVQEDEQRLVQFVIRSNGSFTITSREYTTENSEWLTHCTGKISHEPAATPEHTIDIQKLMHEFTEEINHEELYDPLWDIGFHLGEGFRRIKHTWRKGHDGLCLIEAKSDIPNAEMYREYPGVIDSIFQTLIPISGLDLQHMKEIQNVFIPYTLAEFKYYEKFPSKFYCYSQGRVQENFINSTITVISEQGHILAEIHDLMGKRTDKATLLKGIGANLNKFCYQINWNKQHLALSAMPAGKKLLIFADNKGFADLFIHTLEKSETDIVKVVKGDSYREKSKASTSFEVEINPQERADYTRLFNSLQGHQDILYFWGIEEADVAFETIDKFQRTQKEIFVSLINITHTIVEHNLEKRFSLRLISQSTILTEADSQLAADSKVNVNQSTLWGYARTLAVEYPDLYKGIIDIEGNQCIYNGSLLREIVSGVEQQVSLKENKSRFVCRLKKMQPVKTKNLTTEVKADGTYLVTGGMGSLGLLFCKWLIDQGAKHIVLTGRSALGEVKTNELQLLQKNNVQVQYIAADIAEEASVKELFLQIDRTMPPLKGIIHAAGILDDGMITSQNWDKFNSVFKSKVFGTLNLHNASLNYDIDLFILFSSLAAVVGSIGQSNYSAANEFLNQFATYRRSLGLAAKSIAWGPWSEIGMAAVNDNRGDRLLKQGIVSIKPSDGLKLFETLLNSDVTNPIITQFDWKIYSDKINAVQAKQFFEFNMTKTEGSHSASKERQYTILKELREANADDRLELLLIHNRQLAAEIAGFDDYNQISIDAPVMEQGFDSIMAVEIRNRLAKSLHVELPASLFFNYPSILSIAKHLIEDRLTFDDAIPEHIEQSGTDVLKEINDLIEM